MGDTAQFEHLWLAAVAPRRLELVGSWPLAAKISAIAPIIPLVLPLGRASGSLAADARVFQLIPNISQKDPIKGLLGASRSCQDMG